MELTNSDIYKKKKNNEILNKSSVNFNICTQEVKSKRKYAALTFIREWLGCTNQYYEMWLMVL